MDCICIALRFFNFVPRPHIVIDIDIDIDIRLLPLSSFAFCRLRPGRQKGGAVSSLNLDKWVEIGHVRSYPRPSRHHSQIAAAWAQPVPHVALAKALLIV